MTPSKTSAPTPSPVSPEDQMDFVKMVYKEISENSRYYDGHVWQIPSVTTAVNAFLIGQAFSDSLLTPDKIWVRGLVVLSAAFFTFVLLVALVKHRLHKSAQEKNIEKIEKYMNLPADLHHRYGFPKEIDQVEGRANVIEKMLGSLRANTWLMSVMALTVLVDVAILAGIIFFGW